MFDYKLFRESIRTIRKYKHMTIYELSIQTDLDHDDLSDYERGVRPPTTRALIALLNYFQVTISDCLGDDESLEKVVLLKGIKELLEQIDRKSVV